MFLGPSQGRNDTRNGQGTIGEWKVIRQISKKISKSLATLDITSKDKSVKALQITKSLATLDITSKDIERQIFIPFYGNRSSWWACVDVVQQVHESVYETI